jgi:phenylpropionate dioxygenase-like ring-hydroxylating dioxygenase large terminal subunit
VQTEQARLDRDTDTATLLARARTLPGTWYSDAGHHRLELDAVFRHDWVGVGLDTDVAAPGSYLATTAGDAPVLVVRDESGTLRAFQNVCRHRGAPVAEGCGHAHALRCPYHSWVYRLDGSLARATGVGEPEGFDPDAFGLFEIAVTTFARSILVNLDTAAAPFDPGPLAAAIEPFAVAAMDVVRRDRYERAFNWKVLVENYSENYHTPSIHAQLPVAGYEYPMRCDGPLVVAWDRPLTPRDATEEVLHHFGPLDAEWAGVAACMAPESFYNGVYVTCFPNTMLSVFAGFAATFRLTPTGPRTTIVERDYLWAPWVATDRRERDYEATRLVVEQDLAMCEAMQRTYDARLSAHGVLSTEHEAGVAHVHRRLVGALGSLIEADPA